MHYLEVGRRMECISAIDKERHVLFAQFPRERRQFSFQPFNRLLVGDIEQGGTLHILKNILDIIIAK